MIKEHSPSTPENPYQKFGFTESEILFYRITHKRFLEMLADLTDDDGAIAEFDDLLGFLG